MSEAEDVPGHLAAYVMQMGECLRDMEHLLSSSEFTDDSQLDLHRYLATLPSIIRSAESFADRCDLEVPEEIVKQVDAADGNDPNVWFARMQELATAHGEAHDRRVADLERMAAAVEAGEPVSVKDMDASSQEKDARNTDERGK